IAEEIQKLKDEGVTERELQKAKNQLRANQIMGRQTVLSKTESLHHYRRFHGDPAELNRDLDRFMAVTAEDISAVARKYLTESNRTVLTLVPPQRASGTDEAASESASDVE